MSLSAWDDYPVHQSADWIANPATSDRNFYDRYYFNAFDIGGTFMAIMGLGQYPNLGVTDAFVTVRHGDKQHMVRASRPLGDRSDISVGPFRIEVIEPLKRLRFIVEPNEHSVAMDITWEGFGPAIPEPGQFIRQGPRIIFDTQRLAQTGSWSGTMELGGEKIALDHATTRGSRDRSWGIRPVGEKEPPGILGSYVPHSHLWNYYPMRFDDHCIYYIYQESNGVRDMQQAERVWLDGRIEQLGRIEYAYQFHPKTRLIARATVAFPDSGIKVECTPILTNFFCIGTGYGFEQDWRHGAYQGPRPVVAGEVYNIADIRELGSLGAVDNSARFEYDGKVGYGLLEHAFIGSFPQYGLD